MNEIKLYKSPLSAFFIFLICFVFVVIGVFIVLQANAWQGWLALLFFGFGALISLVMIFDKRPQIIINQKGIAYKKAIWKKYNPDEIIEWETIESVYWASVNNNKFICLKITPKEPKKQNLAQKSLSRLNKAMGFEEVNVPLSLIKIDANKLVDFLVSMTLSNEAQREELIQNFIIPLPKSFFSKFKI